MIEADFCDAFRQKYGDMACWGGVFYDENGVVERDKLLKRITEELSPYVTTRLAQKAKDLLAALRSFCYQEAPQADPTRIHVKGGYITLDGVFHADRYITQNRLDVEYDPAAQPPAVFLDYVNALLEPEDVLTLQEFLGYCCIPTTKAQKMLFLIGSGGEGKSVLTQVLKGVFGASMTSGSLHDLERNRFTLANLEGKLLFLDEDMGVSATKESQVQKRLVTANAPLSIERKGEQAVQAMLTCRLMAFGNVPFSTLYDHSEGAFRRRIILTTKPKQEGRRDDRDLPDKILQGKSGVFNWMLEGLSRLTSNGWEFTISQRARENLEETKRESFNLLGFLADENAVRLGDLSRKITGVDLYDAYTAWCYANGEKPVSRKSVTSYLKQEQQRLGIQASNHVPDSQGGKVRGFAGIEILDRRFLVRGSIRYDRPFSPVEVSQNAP
ncbi:MAG: phage/plasmid primase, P4 family [Acutalibacter sp.]